MKNEKSKLPTIGIIGGGQLGRMFLENASRYPGKVFILENDSQAPATQLTQHFVKGSLMDDVAIKSLAEKCDVLTYEIEHVNTETLAELEVQGKKVIPSARILKIIQDKGKQKQFYQKHGIPTSPFRLAEKEEDWLTAMEELGGSRFAVKTRAGGYDGRGVFLTDIQDVRNRSKSLPLDQPVMIEKYIPCKKELAVMVAVGQDGVVKSFPVVDMDFDPKSNLVTYLYTPAEINQTIENKAQEIAQKVVKSFDGPGLFAVEFFLDHDDQLYVNEIAPRPHNSGHHTIEGAYTSQFDQLYRILTGLPLGDTVFHKAAVMVNIVGCEGGSGDYILAGMDEALKISGVYIHMYGKEESRPDRKLGHVTILGDNIKDAKKKADLVKSLIQVQLV